jgi:hypothetical protein
LEDSKHNDPASNTERAHREGGSWWRRYLRKLAKWWRRRWAELAKWWRRRWAELAKWRRRKRPELTKVVSLIEIKLLQAKLFPPLFPETDAFQEVQRQLHKIHSAKPNWSKDLDRAHVVNHELNQLLPLIATDEYLCLDLEYELKGKKDPESRVLITDLFKKTEIKRLLRNLCGTPGASTPQPASNAQEPLESERQDRRESKTPDRRSAEQLLKRLYEARDEGWTYERALVRLKRNYLVVHAIVIAVLLVWLGRAIVSASGGADPADQLGLVTLAAALGSTLAATRKLRDAVVRLNDLVAVIVVAVVQALIGASLGLVAWLLLASGALQIGDNIAGYTLVAFASGFSEPFSLQLIARFIGTS